MNYISRELNLIYGKNISPWEEKRWKTTYLISEYHKVFLELKHRNTICQGIHNPTSYSLNLESYILQFEIYIYIYRERETDREREGQRRRERERLIYELPYYLKSVMRIYNWAIFINEVKICRSHLLLARYDIIKWSVAGFEFNVLLLLYWLSYQV